MDTGAGIIVDVEATPALRTPEVWSTKTMIERVQDRFGRSDFTYDDETDSYCCPNGKELKRILKMDRLRLRALNGARDEFLLTATAQNLRRMAKILGTGPPGIRGMAPT